MDKKIATTLEHQKKSIAKKTIEIHVVGTDKKATNQLPGLMVQSNSKSSLHQGRPGKKVGNRAHNYSVNIN